jgi:hypothetical protein
MMSKTIIKYGVIILVLAIIAYVGIPLVAVANL